MLKGLSAYCTDSELEVNVMQQSPLKLQTFTLKWI